MNCTKHLHYQGHSSLRVGFARLISSPFVIRFSPLQEDLEVSRNLSVDHFFDEEHNLRNGHIDTSPLVADNPDSIGHFSPLDAERSLPADTPVDDIHRMVISKDCQSLADVSKLKVLRPDSSLFVEDDPSVSSVSSEQSNSD